MALTERGRWLSRPWVMYKITLFKEKALILFGAFLQRGQVPGAFGKGGQPYKQPPWKKPPYREPHWEEKKPIAQKQPVSSENGFKRMVEMTEKMPLADRDKWYELTAAIARRKNLIGPGSQYFIPNYKPVLVKWGILSGSKIDFKQLLSVVRHLYPTRSFAP